MTNVTWILLQDDIFNGEGYVVSAENANDDNCGDTGDVNFARDELSWASLIPLIITRVTDPTLFVALLDLLLQFLPLSLVLLLLFAVNQQAHVYV